MSARQNKKRKTLPRERTVTTLTNGSDPVNITLSPLPPPLAPPFIMSPTFPGSSPNFHYAPFNGFHMVDQQQFYPQQTTQQMNNMTMSMNHMNILPPGDSDLEILERLKQQIKNGQHQIYRAIPQPIALASLYMGPNAGPPHHPEQPLQDGPKSPIVDPNRTRPPRIQNKDTRTSISTTLSHDSISSTITTGMNSIETSDRRTPEYRPLSDRLGPSSPQKPPSQIDRQKLPPPSPATEKSKDPPSRNGSLNIPPSDRHSRDERSHPYDGSTKDRDYHQDRDRNRDLPPRDHRDRDWERDRDRHDRGSRDDRRLDNARRPPPEERHYEPSHSSLPLRRYDPQPPSRTSTLEDIPSGEVSSSNSRDMLPPHRGSSGSLRDAPSSRQPLDDRRAHPPPSPGSTYRPAAARSIGSGGDHVSSDRPSATDRSFRSAPSVPPVSAATQDPRSSSASHSSTPLEDRIANPKPTLQDRLQPPIRNDNVATNISATTSGTRLGRQQSGPPLEERISDPPPPPSSHSSASLPPRPAANTNVGTDSPKTLDNRPRGSLVESERGRPPIPGNARPDRLPAPAPSNAPPRGTSRPPHEERGRSVAAPTTDRNSVRPSSQDRLAHNRAPAPHPNGYRASSVLRDSDAARAPLPPRVASLSPRRRSLPPRERSPPPRINNYRPDENRYNDNFTRRSSDAMDVDNLHPAHSRYGDNHGRHAYAPSRPFSPPSPEDLARDRERARMAFYPRGSSPPRASSHPHLPPPPPANPAYDDDRRDWSYGSSHDYVHGRRDYEDDYWARAAPPPPVSSSDRDRDRDRDRERYERDIHPLPARGQTWDRDPRDDRDSRDRRRPDSPPPPRSSYEPPPPSRSLHSRIADSYPASDRSFAPPPASSAPPPRELDRRFQPPPPSSGAAPSGRGSGGPGSGGVSPPSYSRVRQRSPSPIGRRPPPPSSTNASGGTTMTVDDMRPPPPKRQRDDSYPSSSLPPPPASSSSSSTLPPPPSSSASGYYSPGPGGRGKQEYHHPHMQARIPSPPPPPPPSTGGSVGVGYYERDRERERGRDGYVPPRDYGGRSTYERPRSPPPPPPRGAERAGGGGVYRPANNGSAYVGREDNHRRYMPPPPRTA